MKIKLVSDLHLEFSDITINNDQNCDVLVLAGDILTAQALHDHDLNSTSTLAKRFHGFLKRCSDTFPHVIYVAGNHEFYHGKWIAGIDYLREECDKYSNVYFLEKDTKVIDNITFVGGTLWTNMNKHDPYTMAVITRQLNDYYSIRNDTNGYRKIKPFETVERHMSTLDYFKKVIESDPNTTYVVVGHHAPAWPSVHEQYHGDFVMNGAYYSDLSEFILDHPQIKLWVHGHMHNPSDYTIGETRIVCNPRGYYPSEDTGWDINKIIEIG